MTLLTFKAIHIIGFVAWFAGLFYLPRLFVYHVEALDKKDPQRSILSNQFEIMQKRLFRIILNPAMVLTLMGGIGMLIINPAYLKMDWMHVKLLLVVLLISYHYGQIPIMRKLRKGIKPMSSTRFRLFNEIPTILLVAIVLLAVLRDGMPAGKLVIILTALILLLGVLTFLYKRWRTKNSG